MVLNPKNLSPFALSALALDEEFSQLERLSGELDRLPIDTDNGLERGRLLLTRFSECGQRVGENIQVLAKELTEAQVRAQAAAQTVSARADLIQARQQEANVLSERFKTLGEKVRKVTETVGQLKVTGKAELAGEEKALLSQHLPELDSRLGTLVDEANLIKIAAKATQLKSLERDADAMAQSIQSVRRKLGSLVDLGKGN